MNPEEAGREAARSIREETLQRLAKKKITPDYIISRLKKLSRFKGKKPFCQQGFMIYSEPLDLPDVQLKATVELAQLLGLYPAKQLEVGGHNGRPIEHSHRVDPGGALSTVIERIIGATLGPPSNGHSE